MMQKYVMTLICEDRVINHNFSSSLNLVDGVKNEYTDRIFAIACGLEGFDEHDVLPYDYTIDTYEDWCFIQSILEQEEMRKGAEDAEWGCFPY